MKPFIKKLLLVLSIAALLAPMQFLAGCGKSDEVKQAVEDLSGKTTVDKGQRLKKQINDISDQQVRDVQKKFEENREGQDSGKPDNN